jgi:hypothetical protein
MLYMLPTLSLSLCTPQYCGTVTNDDFGGGRYDYFGPIDIRFDADDTSSQEVAAPEAFSDAEESSSEGSEAYADAEEPTSKVAAWSEEGATEEGAASKLTTYTQSCSVCQCPAGRYQPGGGYSSATMGITCAYCPSGQYQNAVQSTSCKSCPGVS